MNPCSFRIPPARLLASGEQDGYRWEVTVNHMLYRCGYVRLPKDHPWVNEDKDELEVSVHGGLTFKSCGATADGQPDESEYWIGFDCAHAGDAPDATLLELLDAKGQESMRYYLAIIGERPSWMRDQIRSTEYVQEQCLHLIAQALTAAAGSEETQ